MDLVFKVQSFYNIVDLYISLRERPTATNVNRVKQTDERAVAERISAIVT